MCVCGGGDNLTDIIPEITYITYLQMDLLYLVVLIGGYRDEGGLVEDVGTVGGVS